MPKKVILIADPGIDTAFAVALAMHDPNLDVIGLIPCAGNVSAQQATLNVNTLIDELDPPRWPRTASALPVHYELDGTAMHGADGLGNVNLSARTRHQSHSADKVLVELIREHAREVSVVCLGPATTLARAFDRDPEIAPMIDKLVLVGGCWREPGNVGPAAEFHFFLDPESTKRCLHVGLHPLIIPLDVTRKLVLSPSELLELPNPESKTSQFLRKIVPFGIRASSNLYGIEGFHLKDVMGIAAVALAGCITSESRIGDIETKGELTRGMLVVDSRKKPVGLPNIQIGTEAAIGEVRQYINRILRQAP
jgi:inosine-uridine nucleoside N-ribohydrolase